MDTPKYISEYILKNGQKLHLIACDFEEIIKVGGVGVEPKISSQTKLFI